MKGYTKQPQVNFGSSGNVNGGWGRSRNTLEAYAAGMLIIAAAHCLEAVNAHLEPHWTAAEGRVYTGRLHSNACYSLFITCLRASPCSLLSAPEGET